MVRIHTFTSILAVIFCAATQAQALQPQQGWLINVSYQDGSLDLKHPYRFTNTQYEDDIRLIQVGPGFGYAFGNGFTTEFKFNFGALDVLGEIFRVDTYHLIEFHLAAAYDFYIVERFSFGPEVRLTNAILVAKEGEFLNEGPEEEYSLDETALTWGARVKWRATDSFTLALSHYRANYDFGDTQTTGLQFQWHWN